jgi:hypothetical protein
MVSTGLEDVMQFMPDAVVHDTDNRTIAATKNGNGTEKSNVLAFRAPSVAPLQMAA